MPLIPSSVKRSVDATGDEIKTLTDADGRRVQVVADEMGFGTNNVDEASATITYVGKEKADGTWLVMKIDTSSGTAITYATVTNNATVATYAAAWAARAALTYGTYGEAF